MVSGKDDKIQHSYNDEITNAAIYHFSFIYDIHKKMMNNNNNYYYMLTIFNQSSKQSFHQ